MAPKSFQIRWFFWMLVAGVAWVSSAEENQVRQYNYGDNGQTIWMWNCDWINNDIAQKPSSADQCGGVCIANPNCNHFTWTNGICYMKRAKLPTENRRVNGICGWVLSRAYWSS